MSKFQERLRDTSKKLLRLLEKTQNQKISTKTVQVELQTRPTKNKINCRKPTVGGAQVNNNRISPTQHTPFLNEKIRRQFRRRKYTRLFLDFKMNT
jgi:hypothetical protein